MIRISKYQYPIDVQDEHDLDAANSFFILEFECDCKTYIGWTGESPGITVKNKIQQLLYRAFGTGYVNKLDKNLENAIKSSLYVTLTVEPVKSNSLTDIYTELYELMDKYQSYAPCGYNIVNSLNKCAAEKLAISKFTKKWNIPEAIGRKREKCIGRPVFQYKRISENTYKLYKKWGSIREFIDFSAPIKINPSAIYMCCNNQRRVAYGCVWRFNDEEAIIEIEPDLRTETKYRKDKNQAKKEAILAEKVTTMADRRRKFIEDCQKQQEYEQER